MTNFGKKLAVVLTVGAMSLVGSTAFAQVSEDMGVEGDIQQHLAITINNALDFGLVSAPNTGDESFSIGTDGNPVVSSLVEAQHLGGSVAGSFEITGAANENVTITTSITDFTAAATAISLTAVTLSEGDAGAPVTLDAEGAKTITVGGAFTVKGQATAGAYTDATVTIDVVYQ